ncbi:Kelch repeat-containing protein [Sorangium sp. So ce1128]
MPLSLALTAGCSGDASGRGALDCAEETAVPLVTRAMSVERARHTATRLLDGRVLVTASGRELVSCELYDPSIDVWSPAASMLRLHSDHTAVLLQDGKVLVAGGAGAYAEVYDPASDTWSLTGSMLTDREGSRAALLPNGKVLVVGGTGVPTWGVTVEEAEVYNPETGV